MFFVAIRHGKKKKSFRFGMNARRKHFDKLFCIRLSNGFHVPERTGAVVESLHTPAPVLSEKTLGIVAKYIGAYLFLYISRGADEDLVLFNKKVYTRRNSIQISLSVLASFCFFKHLRKQKSFCFYWGQAMDFC